MILYFSGTGNCKYVAEQIAAAVGDTAVSVEDSDGKIAIKKGEIFGMVFFRECNLYIYFFACLCTD